MKRPTELLLVALILLVLACGRQQTVASKSAAAYREAEAKGTAVSGGHDHGHHVPAPTGTDAAVMDHSTHGSTADAHAGHATPAAGATDHHAHGASVAADHAAMGHGSPADAHAGHDAHRTTARAAAHDGHAAMQHGTAAAATPDPHAHHRQPAPATAHAGHGAATQQPPPAGAPTVVLGAPTSSAEMARTQPAATLRPDEFDAPAAIAVAEAEKAKGGSSHHERHHR